MDMHMCVSICVCMCIYVCICVYVCVYLYLMSSRFQNQHKFQGEFMMSSEGTASTCWLQKGHMLEEGKSPTEHQGAPWLSEARYHSP